MDIFPRSEKTGFFGDITRTIVRGRASGRLKQAYSCVEEAQRIAFRRIRNNANAFDIHHAIFDYFSAEGIPTGMNSGRMQGFFHGTGRGLASTSMRPRELEREATVCCEPGMCRIENPGCTPGAWAAYVWRGARCPGYGERMPKSRAKSPGFLRFENPCLYFRGLNASAVLGSSWFYADATDRKHGVRWQYLMYRSGEPIVTRF